MAFPKSAKFDLAPINPERALLIEGFAPSNEIRHNPHPLLQSEASYQQRADEMNFQILRSVQGIHAPLRLMMERKMASKVGHLPILPSSNVMLETLEGRDETIDFNDLYNDPFDVSEYQRSPSIQLDRADKLM